MCLSSGELADLGRWNSGEDNFLAISEASRPQWNRGHLAQPAHLGGAQQLQEIGNFLLASQAT